MVVRMNTIYMAGGLFTIAERRFNRALRDELEMLGYTVFLPQESEQNTRAVFDSRGTARDDQRGVYESEITIVNCDGAMVDDGTALEAGMAIGKCRITIGYRMDFRGFGDDADLKINCMFHLLGDYIYFPSNKNDSDDAEAVLALKIHQSIVRQRAIRQSDCVDSPCN
jgi:nucleoside 2-deoxyribosyltransferase